ncbi:hypothetical protein [Dyella lipolytica]|uniref:Uncharacterized protein n=1 Tax=Dyella lipolytica TaxID=1867835 RepID=A0ABW8IT00_9GAMM|nr:hypothetical protein [Dyella lipolytica]
MSKLHATRKRRDENCAAWPFAAVQAIAASPSATLYRRAETNFRHHFIGSMNVNLLTG